MRSTFYCALFVITVLSTIFYLHQIFTLRANHIPSLTLFHPHIPPNIPYVLLKPHPHPKQLNTTCAQMPNFFKLRFSNDHWQTQHTSKGTFHLFTAYLDGRFNNQTTIRVLTMFDHYAIARRHFYCQLWYENSSRPQIVKSEPLFRIWMNAWGGTEEGLYQPYLISCNLTFKEEIPFAVSIVEEVCANPTNALRINNLKMEEHQKKKTFVVCVKGLSFPYKENHLKLAEWIELIFLLGAEKIHFYKYHVHPKTKTLLEYYQNLGMIEVTPLSLVGEFSNHPMLQEKFLHTMNTQRRLQEVLPYNDCLYKHMNQFQYVVLLDIDEVIVPVEGTWMDLFKKLPKNHSSYMLRNVYFWEKEPGFKGIPQFMNILKFVYRAKNYTPPQYFEKGFHNVDKVIALHNHYPLLCDNKCEELEVNVNLAHLQHYRKDCVEGVKHCEEMKMDTVLDTRLWRFRKTLIKKVKTIMKKLHNKKI